MTTSDCSRLVRRKSELQAQFRLRPLAEWPAIVDRFREDVHAWAVDDGVLRALVMDLVHAVAAAEPALAGGIAAPVLARLQDAGACPIACLSAFVRDVAQHGGNRHGTDHVRRIQQFLERRFDSRVTLEQVGCELRRNPRYLAGLFREVTGRTIHEALRELRLQRAASLISRGDKIESVVVSVGYRSRRAFTSAFKKRFGQAPRGFVRAPAAPDAQWTDTSAGTP